MNPTSQLYELVQTRHRELLADAEQRRLWRPATDAAPGRGRQPISLQLNHLVITISFVDQRGAAYEAR